MAFEMTVMDSFYSDDLGLVVTGEITSGKVKAGDTIKVTSEEHQIECQVNLVSYPGLKIIEEANPESGYLGISIKSLKRGDIMRGDVLCSI